MTLARPLQWKNKEARVVEIYWTDKVVQRGMKDWNSRLSHATKGAALISVEARREDRRKNTMNKRNPSSEAAKKQSSRYCGHTAKSQVPIKRMMMSTRNGAWQLNPQSCSHKLINDWAVSGKNVRSDVRGQGHKACYLPKEGREWNGHSLRVVISPFNEIITAISCQSSDVITQSYFFVHRQMVTRARLVMFWICDLDSPIRMR